MENQIILAMSLEGGGYYSKWGYGRRYMGNSRYYKAILERREPYEEERLNREKDFPLVLQPLLMWSED